VLVELELELELELDGRKERQGRTVQCLECLEEALLLVDGHVPCAAVFVTVDAISLLSVSAYIPCIPVYEYSIYALYIAYLGVSILTSSTTTGR
jgi:hypothetical protein